MVKKTLTAFLSIYLFVLALSHSVSLAASPDDQATNQLTTQAESFRKRLKEAPPKAAPKPKIVVEPEKKEIPSAEGPSFFVRKITVEDSTVFSEKDFNEYITKFENRQLSFSDLKQLAQALTNLYRARGYLTSRVYLPPQKIENGEVVLKALEGRVGAIHVEGARYFSPESYEEAFSGMRQKILKYQDLETSLYYLNQKPDRRVKAYLQSGETPGTSDIILKVEETYPVHAAYEWNNRGTNLTHYARNNFEITHDNLTGHEDILNVGLSFAEQAAFDAGSFQYERPLANPKAKFVLGVSNSDSKLVKFLRPLAIEGKSFSVSPGFSFDFIRTVATTVSGFIGFDFKNSKTVISGDNAGVDRLRVLDIGPRFAFQDGSGKTVLSADFRRGIPDFLGGAKSDEEGMSRQNAGGDFTYYTVNAAHLRRLPWNSLLILQTGGQWTRDTLTSPEEFHAGGAFSVRGYPEADALGDYGWNFSSEIQTPVPFIPENLMIPRTDLLWVENLKLAVFLDGAKTYLRERPTESTVKDRFLLGTGFGIRMDVNKNFSLRLDIGYPIGDDASDKSQKQIHFSVRFGF